MEKIKQDLTQIQQKPPFNWALVLLFLFIGLSIGLVTGFSIATKGMIQIVESVDIDEINIDFNETQMTETAIKYMEKHDMIPTLQPINNVSVI